MNKVCGAERARDGGVRGERGVRLANVVCFIRGVAGPATSRRKGGASRRREGQGRKITRMSKGMASTRVAKAKMPICASGKPFTILHR